MIIRPKVDLPTKISNLQFYKIPAEINEAHNMVYLWSQPIRWPEIRIVFNKKAIYAPIFRPIIDREYIWTAFGTTYLSPERKQAILQHGELCQIPYRISSTPYLRVPGTSISGRDFNALLAKTWNDYHKIPPQI